MLTNINVVIRKGPALEQAVLGIRAAWAMLAAGEFEVNLVFIEDGVYNLRSMPGYINAMLNRFIAEEGKVYALADCLSGRGLDKDQLVEGVEFVTEKDFPALMSEAEAITVY